MNAAALAGDGVGEAAIDSVSGRLADVSLDSSGLAGGLEVVRE